MVEFDEIALFQRIVSADLRLPPGHSLRHWDYGATLERHAAWEEGRRVVAIWDYGRCPVRCQDLCRGLGLAQNVMELPSLAVTLLCEWLSEPLRLGV